VKQTGTWTESEGAIAHVVVSEGLAFELVQGHQQWGLSDYFEAVLSQVVQRVPDGQAVYLTPANAFGCAFTEEEYAAQYLTQKRPDLKVYLPVGVSDSSRVVQSENPPYLDTFDNARLLRRWLQRQGQWPLGSVILYCNWPHALRSWLLFSLCGYTLKQVVGTRPTKVSRTMTPRLWFYDYPLVQWGYEVMGMIYGLTRWVAWSLSKGSRYDF